MFLQNILQFTDPTECFKNLRCVNKFWENSIDTIRFTKHHKLVLRRLIGESIDETFKKLEEDILWENAERFKSVYINFYEAFQIFSVHAAALIRFLRKVKFHNLHVLKIRFGIRGMYYYTSSNQLISKQCEDIFKLLLANSIKTINDLTFLCDDIQIFPIQKYDKLKRFQFGIFRNAGMSKTSEYVSKYLEFIKENKKCFPSLISIILNLQFFNFENGLIDMVQLLNSKFNIRELVCSDYVGFLDYFPIKMIEYNEYRNQLSENFVDFVEHASDNNLNNIEYLSIRFRNNYNEGIFLSYTQQLLNFRNLKGICITFPHECIKFISTLKEFLFENGINIRILSRQEFNEERIIMEQKVFSKNYEIQFSFYRTF